MRIFLVTICLAFCSVLSAQETPELIIADFFKKYEKSPVKAVEELYQTNPWNSRIIDGIESMKSNIGKLTVDYVGKYYGHELIVKKQLSESFVLYSYLVKYDRQPMRFIFKFYKPGQKWTLYSFKFDSDLDDELEQASQIPYLNLDNIK